EVQSHQSVNSRFPAHSSIAASNPTKLITANTAPMRSASIMRMALASVSKGNGLRPTPMALLPPIPLYRRLLRAHRKHLPSEMRVLGDEYIKAEFRAHRTVDNPAHLIGFLTEWQLYAQKIEGNSWVGEKIDPVKVAKMSGEFLFSDFFRAFTMANDSFPC
ncbi:ACN9 family protein, partial [Colletotrichum salicis]